MTFHLEPSYFNPLPPHGGRPLSNRCQSRMWDFNPLPPHGGRPIVIDDAQYLMAFQSTPSAWRETRFACQTIDSRMYFNPLPPHGGRLIFTFPVDVPGDISIHSLRMEGDELLPFRLTGTSYFNPLPPHGGRLSMRMIRYSDFKFQSTPSAWRETMIWK